MAIHVALHHVTRYRYDRPVTLGPQIVRLRPAPHYRGRILSYSLKVEPAQHFINWQQDPFSNWQGRLVFPEKAALFEISVDLVVEMAVFNPFDFFLEPAAENYPLQYSPLLARELAPYLQAEPVTPLFQHYLQGIARTSTPTVEFLVQLNQTLQQHIGYLVRMEPGVQTPEQTLQSRSGSCRDSAWLLVQLLRHLGLAARFVSGYLIQLTPDQKSLDGPSGTEVDFTDLHAWCEVYLPGAGWIGLDPTSGLLAGEGHIPVACTADPAGAAPIEGAVEPAEVDFHHEMSVRRIHESPRVTRPYTEDQWQKVLRLGRAVDERLEQGDVRLTLGGEPTFVAVNGRDAREWNGDALGPTKRGLATELVHKLRAEYAPQGFLHFGQGKWYPGEQLPRWALSICWRADGQPVWRNPALFADERQAQTRTSADAREFILALCQRLGLTQTTVLPAYEDAMYYRWRESRLPLNVETSDARLKDEQERMRLRRVFEQELDTVVGYVLPLAAESDPPAQKASWKTSPWFLRDERVHLLPGDSPMGLRLPLDALPWVAPADAPPLIERDPFAPRPALAVPASGARARRDVSAAALSASARPGRYESARETVRTALCVEVRDPLLATGTASEAGEPGQDERNQGGAVGALYVFMPPLERLEDYLELVAAVEDTAEELGMPVVLEGYPPPRDLRLKILQVTPDPGVIEVNIHPASNWGEVVAHTEFLYQAAFECRLVAEKFMTDGRHTGTGGGNHIVLGAATPQDSPFLRKPELLASLILYWHNHPSLSYLFSGMFIGPTSQAPRVDEARNDQVYEMELALKAMHAHRARHGEALPPWLADRSLRNILIDVTGNTHRSEFCIDKLYSPDSATGRLGLLELRAFEMPPHARMSVVQQLLLRALVARFWEQPYLANATRWGTQLHDRFMLPTFVWMDFQEVLQDLRRSGFDFDEQWFAPHLEFRFPLAGRLQAAGMELSLRTALEPWHVLGEQGAAGNTVRYVDSSLERLEARISGFNPSRHVLACNGVPLALQPTGVAGEFVGGVRFKAWNPPSSLHPTIGVQAPLRFDLVDTWNRRAIAGCQYHVTHPGGRNYDTFPVNAYEAESRRLARFFVMGHTPGDLNHLPPNIDAPASREFPFTLDLRRHE